MRGGRLEAGEGMNVRTPFSIFWAGLTVAVVCGIAGCGRPRTALKAPPVYRVEIPEPRPRDGSLWQPDTRADCSLTADLVARKVGDLVTIQVVENTNANRENTLETNRQSSLDAKLDTLDIPLPHWVPLEATRLVDPSGKGLGKPKPKVSASSKNSTKNDGKIEDKGVVKTTITAQVVAVRPNGNLVLTGSKRIRLGRDVQVITLTGVAAPRDITPDNLVLSTRLYGTRLSISGSGPLTDAQRRSLLSRVFDWINLF